MLNFVNHDRHIEKMDALRTLETQPVLSDGPSAGGPGNGPLDGLSERLIRDVVWRAGHVGLPVNFWDITRSGLPNPLTERFLGQASLTNVKGALPTADNRQAICEHWQFENSMLMSSQLRAFHRSDGEYPPLPPFLTSHAVPPPPTRIHHEPYHTVKMSSATRDWRAWPNANPGFVLTFANQTGVDYLGQPFQDWLNQPESFMADSDVSVLAHIAESFMHSGTSRWHYPTVEWLVVYILTEAAVVPHNIRQGRNSTSLLTAYQDLAREMVSPPPLPPLAPTPQPLPKTDPFPSPAHPANNPKKQTQKRPWERGESPKLVRRYLNCLEELRAIADLAAQKLEALRGMVLDAERFEEEYQMEGMEAAVGDEVETMGERLAWAVAMVEEQRRDAAFLVDYFHTALNEVCCPLAPFLYLIQPLSRSPLSIVPMRQRRGKGEFY